MAHVDDHEMGEQKGDNSSEGCSSDDEASDPSDWLPALQASARLRHVAWRADALPRSPAAELADALATVLGSTV